MQAPLPTNELQRLKMLREFQILDSPQESEYDDITQLAADLCGTPVAAIALIDEDRQWFKSKVAIAVDEEPRSVSFCAYGLDGSGLLVVPDTLEDPRFSDNPLVTGEPHYRFYAGAPIVSADGTIFGSLCVLDHQPRKLSKTQLQSLQVLSENIMARFELSRQTQLERRYRALFEQSPLGIATCDAHGFHARTINERYCEIVGRSREELQNLHFSEYTHPDDLEEDLLQVQRLVAGEIRTFTMEKRFIHRDGAIVWATLSVVALWADGEKPGNYMAVLEDITARKETLTQLREKAALLEHAHDAVVVMDLMDRIIFWNRGATEVFAWAEQEVIGKKGDHLLGIDPANMQAARAAALANDEHHTEMTLRSKTGVELTVDSHWTLVRDDLGQPKSLLMINNDITEKKKLDAHFLRSQRMDSLGTLAGGIAHDLNNTLAPILMSIEILRMRFPDSDTAGLLETLQSSGQRAADLVRQVLAFARGVEGRRMRVDPMEVVREVQKIAHDTFPKSIRLDVHSPAESCHITGDPTQLHQVLLNLCVNARDAMPRGGVISISLERMDLDDNYSAMNPGSMAGSYVLIRVSDTGDGIPQGLRDRIFEPFFTTKEIGKGTGLGLSTTMAIVKSHGGFIQLISEIGAGTEFKIYLPVESAQQEELAAKEQTLRLPMGHNELVLIVDDEEAIRQAVQSTLEGFGYRVLLAKHGAEAISLYAKHREEIAVVITDMAMPIMDGPATFVALKAMNPDVKVIGSSGFSSQGGIARAMSAGLQHFVPKPYTAETLLMKLQEVLS